MIRKLLAVFCFLVISAFAQECQQSYEISTSATAGPIIDNRNRGCQLWNFVYWIEGFTALTVRLEYSIDQQTWTATTLSLTDVPVGKGNVRLYAPYFRVYVVSATGSGKIKYIVGGYKGQYGLADIIAGGGGGGSGYATIQEEGSSLAAQTVLNMIGTGVTCVNNSGSGRTDCTFTGGGGTDGSFLVTAASPTATIAAGQHGCLNSSGFINSTAVVSGNVTKSTGSGSGLIRYAKACSAGVGVLVARLETTLTLGDFACTNVTCTSGNSYLPGDIPIGETQMTTGTMGAAVDKRAPYGLSWLPVYGVGLVDDGNGAHVDSAVIPFLAGATTGMPVGSVASAPSAPNSGDVWYDTTLNKFRCRENGVTVDCIGAGATVPGSNTQLVFNDSSTFGADAGFTYNKTTDVATLSGGLVTGNLGVEFNESDTNPTCAAGNFNIFADTSENKLKKCQNGTASDLDTNTGGSPGGSNTQVQFNNSGAFGGDAGFIWDSTNKFLYVNRAVTNGLGAKITANNDTSGPNLSQHSIVETCIENTLGCFQMLFGYFQNYDGVVANTYWSALRLRQGSSYYNILNKKFALGEVNIGGDADTGAGWMAVSSGGVSRFANVATAGLGLAPIMAAPTESTGQTGNVASTNLLASSHTAGMYKVCGIVAVTAAGTGNTTAWTLAWTSPAGALTHNLFWSGGAAETDVFSVASANEFNVCKVIRSTGATAIALDPGNMNTSTYTMAWHVQRLR